MDILVVSGFGLGGVLISAGILFCRDKSRTTDQFPGIAFCLLGIRDILFSVPATRNLDLGTKGLVSAVFFQGVIVLVLISAITIKVQQKKAIKRIARRK